jgi:hypothetical protein
MTDITSLNDDELAQLAYERLVERLRGVPGVTIVKDPAPHVFSISRNGNMLTATKGGAGTWVLRVHIQWRHRPDGDNDKPTEAKLYRPGHPARGRLVVDGQSEEGLFDALFDRVVEMFVSQTESPQ